ncbi:MarR family winged helix-turn-helix transcriptional regulator [Aquisediminimonas sediminicola]|uniref:MarR family winged helix-turn-helix transcriptional regulator n=1 Tax=Alteraquisediminimonas sediminicola TaxID=2676787 RepID=UPI001C8E60E8|nr:MarR family winged helix-turn-helix transcriptional regulator [Aquisediminimonas sediminicola]
MSQDIGSVLAERLKIRVVTVEYAIVLYLYDQSNVSAGDLCAISEASVTTFYAKLKRMVEAGVVQFKVSATDHRVRLYSLTERAKNILDEEYAFLPDWIDKKVRGNNFKMGELIEFINRTGDRLGVDFFRIDYAIIIQLYDLINLSSADIIALSKASQASSYDALMKLIDIGVVTVEVDANDKRKKIHRLNDQVRDFLNNQHIELSHWISSHQTRANPDCKCANGR